MTDTRKGEGATSLDWAMLRAANLGLSLGENLSKVAEQFRMIEAETEAKSATEIARLTAALEEAEKALGTACGYMRNAQIDLDTGAPKKTALATISGGLKLTEDALTAIRAMVKP